MAKEITFTVGEIVKLKSGGPEMTVKSIPGTTDDNYYCQWFAGKKLEQGRFPAGSLERLKAETK